MIRTHVPHVKLGLGTHQQWFEVQRHLGRVHVARQSGSWSHPNADQALVKIVAAGICGADIRVVTGNKVASSNQNQYVTLGHEGVGVVVTPGDEITELKPGDYAVILPHIHLSPDHGVQCKASRVEPECIGNAHTRHMGWDADGCFADAVLMPATNLVRIAPKYLHLAAELAPNLREATFALVEPMLCTLSAYKMIELWLRKSSQPDLAPGRALVIGCGPIGVLHTMVLLERGFEVWLTDSVPKRAELAQWCLRNRVHLLDSEYNSSEFDLVMVTASALDAIRMGETLVRDSGILYLFAGLNTADRTAMDSVNMFLYEPLHRSARKILTVTPLRQEDKTIHYLGHSGYFEELAVEAIATVARNATELDRAVTGVIRGWPSPRIESRLPGGADWMAQDGSPAIVSVLNGVDLRNQHCKLLVLADNQPLL